MKISTKIPSSHLDSTSLTVLRDALRILEKGFSGLPPSYENTDDSELNDILAQVAERMKDNFPYFHPLYAGQMLKPPHPIARLAYMLALWINPNNHALDGGRASSAMEKEAVADIAKMIGWETHLGHLTGGGTVANLEALWVAGSLHAGKTITASEQAHYTHSRISGVLGLRFRSVPCDTRGRMDLDALRTLLRRETVGTVVATIGTTATGAVDPLADLLNLQREHGFRIHADAAYGGYFRLSGSLAPETRRHVEKLSSADSVVIDPHKHGLQPYGCGCVLFRDPAVGRLYKHDSPYTYFSSNDLHLGEISLECSRPGAAAVALWATQRLFPLVPDGAFSRSLDKGRRAALRLHELISKDGRWIPGPMPELDIVVWTPDAPSASEASTRSRAIFQEAAQNGLHLALADLPLPLLHLPASMKRDAEHITCLRSVLMKPEHADWVDRIWEILNTSAKKVLS